LKAAIKLIQNSHLTGGTLTTLASQIEDQRYGKDAQIVVEGAPTSPALYIIREGSIEVKSSDGTFNNVIDEGGYFGEDMLKADLEGMTENPETKAMYTVTVLSKEALLGVLTLERCRTVIDTTMLGQGKNTNFTSIVEKDIPIGSLTKHAILGAGTFGQVWLVSKEAPDGNRRPYALKIQSKYELVENSQAKGVVQEKNIMAQLHHPFILRLVQSYQDTGFLYMLVRLVQGGELFSLLHTEISDGISEKDSKFYAAGILEGLSYMHRRQILYRDLKPENVLIDGQGYPVIVDLGFGKN
jgi:hypothetical protein